MSSHVLVLGLGSIGMRHAKNFAGLGAKVSGFDPTAERRENFTEVVGGEAFEVLEPALDTGPDLVVVASPNIFHLSQATEAANRNIPVFIEKPLGTNLAEAEEFVELVKKKSLYAHMGSNWKFHPAFKTMKSLLDAGEIGRVCSVNVVAGQWLPDWHPWEDYRQMYSSRKALGGGAIFDTHELDYLIWLLGSVDQISGLKAASTSLDIETEDVAACVMRFKSGAIGSLTTDYIHRVGHRAYRIIGDQGTIIWSYASNEVRVDKPQKPSEIVIDVSLEDLNEAYIAQSQHILDDLRLNRAPITGIDQMLEVLSLQTEWHGDL